MSMTTAVATTPHSKYFIFLKHTQPLTHWSLEQTKIASYNCPIPCLIWEVKRNEMHVIDTWQITNYWLIKDKLSSDASSQNLWLILMKLINSLWPSDAIWWHISGSTLAQVMACCLAAPSHYLNQCWLIISKVQWYSLEGNFTRDTSTINQ